VRDFSFSEPPHWRYAHACVEDYNSFEEKAIGVEQAFSERGGIKHFQKLPRDLSPDEYTHFYFTTFPSLHNRYGYGIPPDMPLSVLRSVAIGDKAVTGIWTLPELTEACLESAEDEAWRKCLCANSFSGGRPHLGRKGTSQSLINTLVMRREVVNRVLQTFTDVKVCFMSYPELPFPLTSNCHDEVNICSDLPTCTVKLIPGDKYSIKDRRAIIRMHGDDLMPSQQAIRGCDLCPETGDESIASVEARSSLGEIAEELEACEIANPIPIGHRSSPAIRFFNFFGPVHDGHLFIPSSWVGLHLICEHLEGRLCSIDEIRMGTAPVLRRQGDKEVVRNLVHVHSAFLRDMPGDALLVGFVRLDREWLTKHLADKAAAEAAAAVKMEAEDVAEVAKTGEDSEATKADELAAAAAEAEAAAEANVRADARLVFAEMGFPDDEKDDAVEAAKADS
jgi:hypothetical protein